MFHKIRNTPVRFWGTYKFFLHYSFTHSVDTSVDYTSAQSEWEKKIYP